MCSAGFEPSPLRSAGFLTRSEPSATWPIPTLRRAAAGLIVLLSTACQGDVGDPQIGTDHPWYRGELACSSFARLFATQAEQYRRATGAAPSDEQDKALAAWFWRNTHYAHGEEGAEDLWEMGFTKGPDL